MQRQRDKEILIGRREIGFFLRTNNPNKVYKVKDF